MKKVQWIDEATAAAKVGRSPRVLRHYVKIGTWKVAYTNLNGRGFMYSEEDIEKLLLKYSTIVTN